jgi:hypothetical protein
MGRVKGEQTPPGVGVDLPYGALGMTTTPPKPIQPKEDDTKWLALLLRRGMLVIVRGIEQKYGIDCGKDKAA